MSLVNGHGNNCHDSCQFNHADDGIAQELVCDVGQVPARMKTIAKYEQSANLNGCGLATACSLAVQYAAAVPLLTRH